MTAKKQKTILLLCADAARHVGTVSDHIEAFRRFSRHHVVILDSVIASRMDIDLSMFDAVVFHYSIVISMPNYLPRNFFEKIAAFSGPKILFIQDEFRWVNRTMDAAEHLGISVLFTVVNGDVVRKIYRNPYFDKVRFEETLTGFVPEELIHRETPAYQDRSIDVSYRARKLPGWCGSFALQKWQIGERFLKDAPSYGLKCDIATTETSRIYGERWIDFIANSRAVLGTESGSSFVDYTGDIYDKVDAYQAANPNAAFDEVREKFLEGRDGETIIHVISPRCFEAASLRSLMIMYPGDYSGVLQEWRHYVPLASDHSNMAEVVGVLRDSARAGEIIDNAYEEISRSDAWTYRAFVARFDRVIDEITPSRTTNNIPVKQVEAEMAGQLARLSELERHYQKEGRWTQRKMRAIFLAHRLRAVTIEFISNKLPAPIARPLIFIDRVCKNALKFAMRWFQRVRAD